MKSKPPQIPFIDFDESSRREYITGFRKRKQERIKSKKENYAKIAKDEKRVLRLEKITRNRELIQEEFEKIEAISQGKLELQQKKQETIVQGDIVTTVTFIEMDDDN